MDDLRFLCFPVIFFLSLKTVCNTYPAIGYQACKCWPVNAHLGQCCCKVDTKQTWANVSELSLLEKLTTLFIAAKSGQDVSRDMLSGPI